MKLIEAIEHLIQGGWEVPNRMFAVRLKKGEISDNRMRTILKANDYYCISRETWSKNKRKHTP